MEFIIRLIGQLLGLVIAGGIGIFATLVFVCGGLMVLALSVKMLSSTFRTARIVVDSSERDING